MLGLSRSRAAELIDAGLVEVGGTAPARSTRLEPGAMLSVQLPEEKPAAEIRPMIAEGMSLVHQDDDLVVIDKPVGVAAQDRKSTRLNSSHVAISYAVFCLKKKSRHGYEYVAYL